MNAVRSTVKIFRIFAIFHFLYIGLLILNPSEGKFGEILISGFLVLVVIDLLSIAYMAFTVPVSKLILSPFKWIYHFLIIISIIGFSLSMVLKPIWDIPFVLLGKAWNISTADASIIVGLGSGVAIQIALFMNIRISKWRMKHHKEINNKGEYFRSIYVVQSNDGIMWIQYFLFACLIGIWIALIWMEILKPLLEI